MADAGLAKGLELEEHVGLWAYFHCADLQLVTATGTPIVPVLVFDQFEEAFTLGLAREGTRAKTQQLLSEAADLIEDRPPEELEAVFEAQPDMVERYVFDRKAYRIVIALREDYLAALESMRARAPTLGRNRFRLLPMNGRQALEAVIKPSPDITSREAAEKIVRIVSEARREDPFGSSDADGALETLEVEPSLLSLFCDELNERRLKAGADRITGELVAGSSQSVLEEFYESALADQPPALRTFVEEELITKTGFRESMSLERARETLRQKGVAPEALDLLVGRRVLRVEERLQVSRVEIIHDLLIEVIRRSRTNRSRRRDAAALAGAWPEKSPFRGLEPFRFQDQPIFFGRAEATRNVLDRLVKNAENGRPFLLILGADGVGKTSLVHAGLIPSLVNPNSVFGIASWRRVLMRPAEHPEGPLAAFADALMSADGLPELAEAGHRIKLGGSFDDVAASIVGALGERQAKERQSGALPAYGVTRLVLAIDQLEELFTLNNMTDSLRQQFVACMQALVATDQIYLIAAMRSALWHRATEIPQLIQLSDGLGRIDLPPPSPAELAEIIRKPAEVAGLYYEVDSRTGVGLNSVIAEDAAAQGGVLPLLSFLLETLYVEDVSKRGGRTLTYETYKRLDGLRGAIASRAEETVARLPNASQSVVQRVIRAISSPTSDGQALTARAAPIDKFAPGSDQRAVVDAMIEARLLVTSTSGSATIVRPAHEALLTHWSRARDVLTQDRRDLETRAMLEQQFKRWQSQTDQTRKLVLLRDPDLANAVDLARRWGDELDPAAQTFIRDSSRHAVRQQRRTLVFAVSFAIMAELIPALVYFAAQQRKAAGIAVEDALQQQLFAVRTSELALNSTIGAIDAINTTKRLATNDLEKANLEADLEGFDLRYIKLVDGLRENNATTIRLLAARPEIANLQYDLAVSISNIGDLLVRQGDKQAALEKYNAKSRYSKEARRSKLE